ncbi:MAG: hypothetical protein WCJ09_10355 [Planctomycetota bacterium]
MKTLIQLIVVAVIFGGISAAATLFLQPQTTTPVAGADDSVKTAESTEKTEKPKGEKESADHPSDGHETPAADHAEKSVEFDEHALAAAEPPRGHSAPHAEPSSHHTPDVSKPEARVAVRPPYTPDGDEAGSIINLLRERSRIASENERKLAERQDAMQLIFEDLRAEQARTLKIRQRLSAELKESRQAVDAALEAIEVERSTILKDQTETRVAAEEAVRIANEERDKLRKQLEKSTNPQTGDANKTGEAASGDENANLKKMAAVFDTMPAENVAKVVEQLVKTNKTDAVVSLLNVMKDRQTAKVLGLITETNPQLAADLSDRIKRLKSATAKPAVE